MKGAGVKVKERRKFADGLVNRFGQHVPYRNKIALWRAYDFQAQSLTYTLTKHERNFSTAQVEDLLMVIALATVYRQIFLQIDGVARFGRRLTTRFEVDALVAGTSTYDDARLKGMMNLVDSYRALVVRMKIPIPLLEYAHTSDLVDMYLDDAYWFE